MSLIRSLFAKLFRQFNGQTITTFQQPTSDRTQMEANNSQTVTTRSISGLVGGLIGSFIPSIRWCPTSDPELEEVEAKLLSVLKWPNKQYFVDIGAGWNLERNLIRTVEMIPEAKKDFSPKDQDYNPNDEQQPLVLIHGFAAGTGFWILNLDELASMTKRRIYAFDILGFGRSSRPTYDLGEDVEHQFVESIERWRIAQNIDKFILLGHSFGGYLTATYALKHPERVQSIILADPWGVADRQMSADRVHRLPLWVRSVNQITQHFTPLSILRVSGPYGPRLVHKFRPDLKEKFRCKLEDDCDIFLDYIYHCNAQNATGEVAFKSLTKPFGWAKRPLIQSMQSLNENVNVTFIYGARSWIEKSPGELLRGCMPNQVTVEILQGCGHHVYADKSNDFNELVRDICRKVAD